MVPTETAQHGAALATGSFLSLLPGTWAQTSSAGSQRHVPAPKTHGVRPLEAWQRVALLLRAVATLKSCSRAAQLAGEALTCQHPPG